MFRVTQNRLVQETISNAQERYNRYAEAQRQVTSGVSIERISQDPRRGGAILEQSAIVSRVEQYIRNAESVKRDLSASQNSVENVSDLLTRVRQKTLRASNQTLNEVDRAALASELDQDLSELLRIANEKNGGKYIFGYNEPPFESTIDEDGRITEVVPTESAGHTPISLAVGERETLMTGIASDDLFSFGGDENLFQMIIDIRTAVLENDIDNVTGSLDRIDDAIGNVSSSIMMVGNRLATAENTLTRLEDSKVMSSDHLSELVDTDVVEAITRYNMEQAYYEMTLRASAQIIRPSLINFL